MFELLNRNFFTRFISRYLSIFCNILIFFFLVQLDEQDLAIFFLIRAGINFFSFFYKPIISGQYFYKKLSNLGFSSDFEKAVLNHLATIAIMTFCISIAFSIMFSLYVKFNPLYSLSYIEIFFIAIWFIFFISISPFQHIFQILKKDTYSGLSTGFLANLLILLILVGAYSLSSINLKSILMAYSLGYVLCFVCLCSVLLLSFKNKITFQLNFYYFKNKDIYSEGLIGTFSSILPIILLISGYIFDYETVTIIGMTFFVYGFVQQVPMAFLNSTRKKWLDYKDVSTYLNLKISTTKIISFLYIFFSLGFLILLLIFSNLDILKDFKNYTIFMTALICVQLLIIGNLLRNFFFGSLRIAAILKGGADYILRWSLISFMLVIFLYVPATMVLNFYAAFVMVILQACIVSIASSKFLEKLNV